MENKELPGEGKFDLAKKTMCDTLASVGLSSYHIGQFLSSIRETNQETLDLLNQIDGGIDKYGSSGGLGLKPTGKIVWGMEVWDIDHSGDKRRDLISYQNDASLIGAVLSTYASINGVRVDNRAVCKSVLLQEDNRPAMEIIQLCFLQLLALDCQVEQRHFNDFRGMAKYMRRYLELERMDRHFEKRPTYTIAINHIDLFVWILEQRVRTWDAAAKAGAAAKSEPKAKTKRKKSEPKKTDVPPNPNYVLWRLPKKED